MQDCCIRPCYFKLHVINWQMCICKSTVHNCAAFLQPKETDMLCTNILSLYFLNRMQVFKRMILVCIPTVISSPHTLPVSSFCLCPSSDSMILLGSIERLQLQSLLSLQLSLKRRMEYLRQLAQDNGTQDHLPSLTTDSTPSSPCGHTNINASTNTRARQAVRFLVSTQQV